MCFTIPVKVLKVAGKKAVIEGGKTVVLTGDISVKKGEYLQVIGDAAVARLNRQEGLKVRLLIKSLS
ncbi:hypothetical protein A3J20_03065 [Candidatus Gottesmanbacteria bacterium RIFCSPLOWO2_02_FULL_42_29]|uniref:HypC/HybG/HupF family hydrogenase formation chaperone n=2 Tax=Candidatus Gottesmaniibacteriota TaxID=1752720 RepID=A0A1F6B7M7_9BACT|nr:MAG: hypothetical protein UV09_C0003G0040 [Candidatus Gottesmanbacteria bacterium GW2011_GWA2_42_18]KKS75908.1 MAG: hypothetical protein UV46_C0011G0005 [Candidatus Gottesmanbacteria bacterium GW2011_GWC2_42_8]OGG10846.1 MAG: hypothetical protein A2781_01960 [Candidatus Gottesmanbacteria bacterium RIFCSPHIGHO2_01_FULL_42_27]OGG19989.1 MAG: hypothetical protein A3E72_01340 [Candidatus Gottesmanbacteria bacterium RIFCSPHIGHO2_12_FULL_43_26]OGG32939.1 MAG: hypothetical protein A2968_06750 [Cand